MPELFSLSLFNDSTLKAYYRLEANSNDATANAHNGSDVNATFNSSNGKFGNGVSYATGDSVIPNHADFRPATNFSVGNWIKTTASADQYSFVSHFRDGSGQQAGWKLLTRTTGVSQFQLGAAGASDGTYNDGIVGFSLVGSRVVNDGSWHFIVGTYDGSNMRLYVDGELDNSRACTITVGYDALNTVRIGADSYEPNPNNMIEGFTGSIDDVFIFNGKVLSSIEVASIFDSSIGGYFFMSY